MRLTFLGTRGQIEPRTRRHRRHTVLLIEHRWRRILIDAGEDWLGRLQRIAPHAIVITHAHWDHMEALGDGVDCPVYATAVTWKHIAGFPIKERHTVRPGRRFTLWGVGFTAVAVEHSVRCPAVGFRIDAGGKPFFYVPDIALLPNPRRVLAGVELYIGDGARMKRPLVREQRGERTGHASIYEQVRWCGEAGVQQMLITHCGSEIVAGDERKLGPQLQRWADEYGMQARFAYDGMQWEV